MKTLTFNEMMTVECGRAENATVDNLISSACDALTIGSIAYGTGLLLNWWNPVGWADAAFLIATGACLIYAKS